LNHRKAFLGCHVATLSFAPLFRGIIYTYHWFEIKNFFIDLQKTLSKIIEWNLKKIAGASPHDILFHSILLQELLIPAVSLDLFDILVDGLGELRVALA
jgi:hypothetical protein